MVERLTPQDLLPATTVSDTNRLRIDQPDGSPIDIMRISDHSADMDPALLALSAITEDVTAGRHEMSKIARFLYACASTSTSHKNMLATHVSKEFEACRLAVPSLSGIALGVPLFVVAEVPNAQGSLFAAPFVGMRAVRADYGVGIEPFVSAIRVNGAQEKQKVEGGLPEGFHIPHGLYYASENTVQ